MKTTFKYDHYYGYEELKSNLEYFAEKYPQLVDLQVNVVTLEGRNQYGVTVTNKNTGDALSKPGFHVDGNHHAGEITGSMAAMHMLDYLITNYGEDPAVTKMLDTMTIYFVPRVSPDGTETWLTTPYTIRSVNRPHNVKKGGVQEEDLDGDGVIRMMRIPTPFGAWKKDPEDPDKMTPRDPGDRDGEFYDIYPEGVMEAYDGDENLKVKKNEWALDFNRNYPYGWFPENRQPGAGKYPLSNPENKAMADWIIAHPNIGGVSTNHTSGGMLLYPPGTKPVAQACQDDITVFKTIAEMGKEEMGYEILNIYEEFVQDPANYDSGAFDDWCYQSQGLIAYTIEYWDLANKAGAPYVANQRSKETPADSIKRFNACMAWVKENAPEYYTGWKEYDHPYFGKVELGGFNYKFTHQNPPAKFLGDLMEQSTKFLIRFAKSMPQLVIDCAKAEKLGDDLFKVTAVVGNTGYLPTNISDEALKMGIAKEVKVSICCDCGDGCKDGECSFGLEILSGKAEAEIGHLSGYSRTKTGVFFYGNIGTRSNAAAKKKLEWIIKAPAGSKICIKAVSEKAGAAEAAVTLE